MVDDKSDGSVSLSHYLTAMRRWWWVIVLSTTVGTGAAAGYLAVVPQQATATTSLNVSVITNDPFNPARSASGLLDMDGEAEVARSFEVAERVAGRLRGDYTSAEVRRSLEVVSLPDTSILRISAEAGSEQEARVIADTVAEEFLSYRSETVQSRIDREVEASRVRVDALRDDLAVVNERAAQAEADEDTDALNQAETDRSLISFELNNLLQQLASAESIDTTPGAVLNPAARNAIEWSPPVDLVLATGFLTGLGLGLVLALLCEALRSHVHGGREVEGEGGGLFLGAVEGGRTHLPATGADLETFRAVRERWLSGVGLDEHGVCAVVNLCPGGWADDVAVNFAYAVTQSGRPVEFIGVDLEPEVLSAMVTGLGLEAQDGDGMPQDEWQASRGARYVSASVPGLAVFVPSASVQADTGAEESLSSAVRAEVGRRRAESLVILGLGHGSSDATRLGAVRLADAVTLVVGKGQTTKSAVREASADVARMGTHLVGSMVVTSRRTPTPVPRDEARTGGAHSQASHSSGRPR